MEQHGTGARWIVCLLAGMAAGSPARTAEPVATFAAREVLGKEWARTLVTYPLELKAGQARPESVRLVDGEGVERPCQLTQVRRHGDGSLASARVSFYAALPRLGGYTFQLLPEAPAAVAGPRVTDEGPYLTLDNGLVALRLPRTGQRRPAAPLRFGAGTAELVPRDGPGEAGLVPGPIQGVRLADGRWTGGSTFWSADGPGPRVVAYHSELTEQGPLFAEARIRYDFENGGFYELTVRLLTGDAAIRVDEQLDLKQTGRGDRLRLVVWLSGAAEPGGWRPDSACWVAPRGELPHDKDLDEALRRGAPGATPPNGGVEGSQKLRFNRTAKVFGIEVWYPWQPAAHYFCVVRQADLGGATPCPGLAVVPLHAGSWRGNQQGYETNGLYTHADGGVAVHWPLVADPHPNSLLHTGESDPAKPLTFRRRVWALVAGPVPSPRALFELRDGQGNVGLDRYKDWILDWAEDPAVTYPRLVVNPAQLQELRPRLGEHPAAAELRKRLYFQDDPARRQELLRSLTAANAWGGPRAQALNYFTNTELFPWHSSYRQSQMAGWCHDLDELFSSSGLATADRHLLRSHVAALAHLLAEPDFNPRGSLVHLGNPNMPVNRFFALTFAAALIPDHPRAREWLDVSEQYVRFKLAANTAPGGAWSELLTYFMPSMHAVQAALVLERAGRLSAPVAELAALPAKFTLQLVAPPDPRFGARALPNWGHEGCQLPTNWLVAAALTRQRDPELARALEWAWDELGRPLWDHHDAGFSRAALALPDLLARRPPGYVPPSVRGAWLPGFGAVLRAHAGDPQETYLSYRQGYLVSHSDANQGDFVLYAKGALLSTLSLFGYAIHDDRPFGRLYREFGWHNRVRFGGLSADGGWPGGGPLSQVHAHSFGDSVDYLRGLGDYGAERWTRQVLLLKGRTAAGPNYFVFRDSFHQAGTAGAATPKWWYLRTPGPEGLVTATAAEIRYTSPHGARLDAHFLQPAAVTVASRAATQEGVFYGQAARNWERAHNTAGAHASDLATNLSSATATVAETMTVTAAGAVAPGVDILVALYPRAAGEKPPRYEALSDGVARITTSESTDYVFLGRRPMKFKQGDVEFEGTAGAVRIRDGEFHLCIADGPGRASYRGVVLSGSVPATRVLALDKGDRPQVLEVPPPKTDITFALAPERGPIEEVVPGVRRQVQARGYAVEFDAQQPLTYARDNVVFEGKRGGVEVDTVAGTARLVLLDGEKIGAGFAQAWGCTGPYDLTFSGDDVTGVSEGAGRFLSLSRPPRLDGPPALELDGQAYAVGAYGDTLVVPLMPGPHRWALRALRQPPVFQAP